MKKILSILLIAAMLLSTAGMTSFASTGWTEGSADVDLRVGILGDTHTSTASEETGSTFYWFKQNIKAFLEIGRDKLFVWDNMTDIIPLAETKSFSVQ